ncbi:class I SAM-dependent methyltransferase [Nitrosopumilus sp.]|uniref:class I SAM-dependent methyltransferase n=1 Tax=Nitrosopumilus sp. TaxID=2024843 RepID=UPI00262A93F0|nr:class I SAM-dependent methyltransferase [Nitrosopumilus sp.]
MFGEAWDDMSSEYDGSVENNPDHVISNFIEQEIQITSEICKKIIGPEKKFTIIDLGSGTGRVLFALQKILGDSVSYCGLDASKPMVELSNMKKSQLDLDSISFFHYDVTNPKIDELFDDSIKIVMCMYNTIGVIPAEKRKQFFENIMNLAGKDGLGLISAFNGNDFSFVAPKIYHPMKKMVKRIDDDSFDEKKVAFRNSLGYYSQWFTKSQINEFLGSTVEPIPITVDVDGNSKTMGHVFTNRQP